ncbi:MAG: ferredoxin oxidoreductase [Patescibacteria group bacterium]|nr:ferredoxin oxidoreductase [Patescibacteria group bacterium]
MSEKMFIIGNEALGRAARAAGARAFYGYPITPTSEVAHYWAKQACSEKGVKDKLVFLQAEDETGAGFMLIGGVLAGTRSFTATAGPGHVLMQDAFAMAEAMRVPVVAYINQRGGPSTSTVIYSQQEVNLACYGGNGNGYRVVYSLATLQEMYDYGIKVFNTAWKYRFPTFLLGDGYLGKMMGEVEVYAPEERGIKMEPTEAYMLERNRTRPMAEIMPEPNYQLRSVDGVDYDCYRNCLNMEEQAMAVNTEIKAAFDLVAPEIIEYEEYGDQDADDLIVAHGIVSAAAKVAIDDLAKRGVKSRLFRPITLRPFPVEELRRAAKTAERIIVPESADNQLARIIKDALCGHIQAPIVEYGRPCASILPREIADLVTSKK